MPGHTSKNLYPRIRVENCIRVEVSILAKSLSVQLWGMRNASPSQAKLSQAKASQGNPRQAKPMQAKPGPKPGRPKDIRFGPNASGQKTISGQILFGENFSILAKSLSRAGVVYPGRGTIHQAERAACPSEAWVTTQEVTDA